MNWLAHLHLAGADPLERSGAVLADVLKGGARAALPDRMRAGVAHHCAVDAWTDRHPLHRRSRGRVAPERRRFAGILTDLFYDRFLSLHWPLFSDVPLRAFVDECYAQLDAAIAGHAPAARGFIERMIAEDWLIEYSSEDGMERTLARVARRLKRPSGLARGIADLRSEAAGFESDFLAFYPDLRRAAAVIPV